MFSYLSKILPLFAYPLGLASLLMFTLLVADLWQRQWGWRSTIILIAFLVLWIGGNTTVAHWFMHTLEKQHPPLAADISGDMIVVLGGATRPATPPRTIPEVRESGDRVTYAAYLYQQGVAPRVLAVGGGVPWLRGSQEPTQEADNMRTLLMLFGVADIDILTERQSENTYENALFAKEILEEENVERVILVTSAFHMPRSVAIFEKQGIEVIPAPSDFYVTETTPRGGDGRNPAATLFYALPQIEPLHMSTIAMREYFGLVVYRLRGWL